MTTITKIGALMLGELLRDYGIRHIVVSSGSRCAPLSVTFARMGCFILHPVIDERSAGFIALGISLTLHEPVAMVCTSGSAALNYAPALAEAYYRRIPLVAITADRPSRFVGQREGQTIRQAGALSAVVGYSIDIPDSDGDKRVVYHINRLINEALTKCTGSIPRPVHINIQFETPLTPLGDTSGLPSAKVIKTIHSECPNLAHFRFNPAPNSGILLYIGGVNLSETDISALSQLNKSSNIAILADAHTNLPGAITPMRCERLLNEAPIPELVAVLGGDSISSKFKAWLRNLSGVKFISGGYEDCIVDTFGQLDTHIDCSPSDFAGLLSHMASEGDYKAKWRDMEQRGLALCHTDSTAVRMIQKLFDMFNGTLIHVSNGTCARIAQLVNIREGVNLEINRGVSGIDGCTSTAIGAAMAHHGQVLLLTGDMSAAYDIGALATIDLPQNFKMAVLDNNGGDIFRNIPTTAGLPELERLFAMKPRLPLQELAAAYGFGFYRCDNVCIETIKSFINHDGPAMLQLKVSPEESAGII